MSEDQQDQREQPESVAPEPITDDQAAEQQTWWIFREETIQGGFSGIPVFVGMIDQPRPPDGGYGDPRTVLEAFMAQVSGLAPGVYWVGEIPDTPERDWGYISASLRRLSVVQPPVEIRGY